MSASNNSRIVVVGAGPVGLMAAIALAAAEVPVTMVAPRRRGDNRTSALLASSVTALETLGVWTHGREKAAPLRVMRIVDATQRLIRAPEISFQASEIGLDAFGYNIANVSLIEALTRRAADLPCLNWIEDEVRDVSISEAHGRLTLGSGEEILGELVVGADGRQSACRAAAGIETQTSAYPQTALTFNVSHYRPHDGISTEFHTESGPFTLVPLRGNRSSLVWVVEEPEANRISALGDEALALEIEHRAGSILGKMQVEVERGSFPLSSIRASCLGTKRVALIGESAHVLPPIGAQGLNLGLRDAAALAELVAAACRSGEDPGSPAVLDAYGRARRTDVTSRTLAVDWLNRSLLSDFLPVQGLRGAGMAMLARGGPLRRAVLREGVAPAMMPALMRGERLLPCSSEPKPVFPQSPLH